MKNQEISTLIGQKRAYNSSSFLLYSSIISLSPSFGNQGLAVKEYGKRPRNIAILASKKHFKTAVSRNKARRLIRNAINKVIYGFNEKAAEKKAQISEYNLIFSLKKGFEKVNFKDLVEEIRQGLIKNAII